jgi:hypothetical protein
MTSHVSSSPLREQEAQSHGPLQSERAEHQMFDPSLKVNRINAVSRIHSTGLSSQGRRGGQWQIRAGGLAKRGVRDASCRSPRIGMSLATRVGFCVAMLGVEVLQTLLEQRRTTSSKKRRTTAGAFWTPTGRARLRAVHASAAQRKGRCNRLGRARTSRPAIPRDRETARGS